MSAFMWQVVQQRNVSQYDKVADFIGLVTHAVPELLNPSQTAQLLLGLRAKVRGAGLYTMSTVLKLVQVKDPQSDV